MSGRVGPCEVLVPRAGVFVLLLIRIIIRARHTKWRHECGMEPWDEGVQDHDLAMRMFEWGPVYDQLNLGAVMCLGQIARRSQSLVDAY